MTRDTSGHSADLTHINILGAACLFALSWATASETLLVVALLWAFFDSARVLLRTALLRLSSFSLCATVGAATSATFLGGALPLQFEMLLFGQFLTPPIGRSVLNTNVSATAAAGLYLTAFRYISELLARWDRPRWHEMIGRLKAAWTKADGVPVAPILVVAVLGAAYAALFAAGLISVNQAYVERGRGGEMPIWLSLIQSFAPAAAMLAVMILATHRTSPLLFLLAAAALAATLLFAFAFGRRAAIFTLVIAVATHQWLRPRPVGARVLAGGVLIGLPALIAISVLFQAIRLAYDDLASVTQQPSFIDVALSDALPRRLPEAIARAWSDLAIRAYSISFFADIFEHFEPEHAFMGTLTLYTGVLRTVPSLLWPDKIATLASWTSPELPVQHLFKLYVTDQAMPIAMIGYADWWILGALIAPLSVLLISLGFCAIASTTRAAIPQVAALASALFVGLNSEFEYSAALIYLRFSLLVLLIFACLAFPFARRMRPAGPRGRRER